MADEETRESIEVAATGDDAPYPAPVDGSGLNIPVLLLFAAVVAVVAASNLWLRRRAERNGGGNA